MSVTKQRDRVILSPAVTERQGRAASTITNTPEVELSVFTDATLVSYSALE